MTLQMSDRFEKCNNKKQRDWLHDLMPWEDTDPFSLLERGI